MASLALTLVAGVAYAQFSDSGSIGATIPEQRTAGRVWIGEKSPQPVKEFRPSTDPLRIEFQRRIKTEMTDHITSTPGWDAAFIGLVVNNEGITAEINPKHLSLVTDPLPFPYMDHWISDEQQSLVVSADWASLGWDETQFLWVVNTPPGRWFLRLLFTEGAKWLLTVACECWVDENTQAQTFQFVKGVSVEVDPQVLCKEQIAEWVKERSVKCAGTILGYEYDLSR